MNNTSLWKVSSISDLVTLTQGLAINSKTNHLLTEDGGLPLLRIKDLFDDNPEFFIKEQEAPESTKVRKDDIVFTRTGQVGYVFTGKSGILHNNCFKIIPKDPLKKEFLYWYLKLPNVIEYIRTLASGSAQPDLKHSAFKSLVIKYPEMENQIEIAKILSEIVNLEKVVNKKIKEFDKFCQLLYHEWFVEFRFPGHENVKFVDSGFGKIPEGWEITTLSKQRLFRKTSVKVSPFEGEKQYYQTSEIDGLDIVGNGEIVTYHHRPSRAGVEPLLNAIYLARMKESNKVLYFRGVNQKIAESILLSTGMFGYQTTERYFGYLFSFLNSYYFKSQKDLYATGATQVSLTDENLGKIKVILPREDLLERYSKIVNPMLDQILVLQMQNKTLESIRDLLLPKLMSGEIDVSKLDININEK